MIKPLKMSKWLLNNLIAKSVTHEAKLKAKYPELKGKSFTKLK